MLLRDSKFELLRIIAIFGIILFHYSDHGCNSISPLNSLFINYNLQSLFRIGGGFGNIIFILLSGYFSSKSEFKWTKVVKLYGLVLFYSIFAYLIYIYLSGDLSYKIFIISITPFTHDVYWFFSSYIILYIFSPILNVSYKSLGTKNRISIILSLFYITSVLPQNGYYFFVDQNRLLVFFTVYLIGCEIKLQESFIKKIPFFIIIPTTSLIFIYIFISIYTNNFSNDLNRKYEAVWGMEKTPIILFSVTIFFIFIKIHSFYSRIINLISSSVFSVYLIHMNPLTTFYIWDSIFNIKKYYTDELMIPYMLFTSCILLIVCLFIDYIRKFFLKLLFILNRNYYG